MAKKGVKMDQVVFGMNGMGKASSQALILPTSDMQTFKYLLLETSGLQNRIHHHDPIKLIHLPNMRMTMKIPQDNDQTCSSSSKTEQSPVTTLAMSPVRRWPTDLTMNL